MERVTEAAVRRQHTIQTTLLLIILATLPCYCVGFVLLGIAPNRQTPGTPTLQGAVTATGAGAVPSDTLPPPTITLIPSNFSTLSPLLPTPTQFRFFFTLTFTPIPPTPTPIPPTDTPIPTDTPVPATNTPIPASDTPAPATSTHTPTFTSTP